MVGLHLTSVPPLISSSQPTPFRLAAGIAAIKISGILPAVPTSNFNDDRNFYPGLKVIQVAPT